MWLAMPLKVLVTELLARILAVFMRMLRAWVRLRRETLRTQFCAFQKGGRGGNEAGGRGGWLVRLIAALSHYPTNSSGLRN